MKTDAALPDELVRALEEAVADLAAHPHAELVLPKRKKIWAAMGPTVVTEKNRAVMTPGLRRRTELAVITAEDVLPIWERHWDSKDPHRMLEVARAYMRGEIGWDDAWEVQNTFSGGLENANTDEIPEDIFHFIYVGYAAVDAVATALKEMDCEDDGTLDEDLDMWDGSFWACSAYSGDFPWEARSDKNKRREMADDKDDKLERSPRVACMARRQPNVVNLHRRVEARILYPALGFPEVIGPPVEINRMNGTSSIHLLLLADKADLKPRDVAWHLRYAKLSEPVPRYLDPSTGLEDKGKAGTTPCSFPESEIEVKPVSPGPADEPVQHPSGELEYAGAEQVTFARGFIRANLSRYVLQFYKDAKLPHLYEVAIYEKAAARVPAGGYTLLWNNLPGACSRKKCSCEMERLSGYFYRERESLAKGPKKLPCPPREEYLFEYGEKQDTKHWVEVLHPLFVLDKNPDDLSVAHMTDPHVCVRAKTFEDRIATEMGKLSAPAKFYNNYNTRFKEVYPKAQSCDVVLLTGDIVDYGRGYAGEGKLDELKSYLLDRNWFLFYRLLAGVKLTRIEEVEAPVDKKQSTSDTAGDSNEKPGDGKSNVHHSRLYTKPVYTVLGNHDWRQDPYGPISWAYTIHEDVQLNKDELGEAHGPGATDARYDSSRGVTATQFAAELWALLTSLDSVKWYLLLVNPFLDYVARHPGGFCFLMLDWAKEEKVIVLEKLGAILPVAKASLTELQKGLVEWFLQLPEGAKSVGLHAGIVSPDPTDDALRRGYLVPCPLCRGTRINPDAQMLTDRGLSHGARECDCTRMMAQPASDREPSRLPYLAITPQSVAETKVPNDCMPVRGTIMWHRDWFIRELMRHKVAAVFSGHAHRTALLWVRQKPSDDFEGPAVPAGTTMLVERLPLKGDATPPVFVNTSSAGPVGWRRPKEGLWIPERPGIAIVKLRFDGAVLSARYEATSVLPLRAKVVVDKKKNTTKFIDKTYKLPEGYPPSTRDLVKLEP